MEETDVQWVRRRFRRHKVWLAVDAGAQPLVRNGKVRIKYRLDQPHEYWVRPENVTDVDPPATEAVPQQAAARPGSASRTRSDPPPADDPSDGAIEIYTDGASSGNPGPSGIGIVMRFGAHEKEISRFIGRATNNVAELEAIRVALSAVTNRNVPVRIYTDSAYALGVLTRGWKAQKNRELIAAIQALMARFREVRVIKIAGHAGHDGNERADRLAVRAIRKG